ncbi:hypothetical protein [Desulfovibrio inopinatus]|uniref:hypothetical protein n=1 Tax=Desulfovibrio inopinatus TaxID=102109 RepID=UPI0004105E49|nr:hypothetical protein [Desulfovibrio inopinatus]
MKRLALLVLIASMLAICLPVHAGSKMAMAMSDRKIYTYYRNVEHALRMLDTANNVDAQYKQICSVYVSVMTGLGFDFQKTINHALDRLEGKTLTMDNPDLRFLLGLYRVPPEKFLQFGYIDEATYKRLTSLRDKTQQE